MLEKALHHRDRAWSIFCKFEIFLHCEDVAEVRHRLEIDDMTVNLVDLMPKAIQESLEADKVDPVEHLFKESSEIKQAPELLFSASGGPDSPENHDIFSMSSEIKAVKSEAGESIKDLAEELERPSNVVAEVFNETPPRRHLFLLTPDYLKILMNPIKHQSILYLPVMKWYYGHSIPRKLNKLVALYKQWRLRLKVVFGILTIILMMMLKRWI